MINSRRRIIVSLCVLSFVFLALIGVSYAYYAANVKGNNANTPSLSLRSGYLAIEYTDGSSSVSGGSSSGVTEDLVYTKAFTVANSGVNQAYYGVWIKNISVKDSSGNSSTFSRPQDWTYELKVGEFVVSAGQLPTVDEMILTARGISTQMNSDNPENLTLTVKYDYITAEDVTTDNGDVYGEYDQTEDQGKTLSFDVVVTQNISNFDNAEEDTLLYAINRDNELSADITIPGRSASTEAILSSGVEDDYGTSYYYRGNVTNNFVNYSGMCWRIVRIDGNGNIKLVLADEDNECNDDGSIDGTAYDLNNTSSAFINDASKYLYNHNTYTETDMYFEESMLEQTLEDWGSQLDVSNIVTAEWCNDMSVANVWGIMPWMFEYSGFTRMYPNSSATPSLKCNQNGYYDQNGNISKALKVENTIGLLTADEMAFAGANMRSPFSSTGVSLDHYLVNNATSNKYWTITPYSFDDGGAFEYFMQIDITGEIISGSNLCIEQEADIYFDSCAQAVRPAILINSTAKATTNSDTSTYGEPGTQTNPYVIN